MSLIIRQKALRYIDEPRVTVDTSKFTTRMRNMIVRQIESQILEGGYSSEAKHIAKALLETSKVPFLHGATSAIDIALDELDNLPPKYKRAVELTKKFCAVIGEGFSEREIWIYSRRDRSYRKIQGVSIYGLKAFNVFKEALSEGDPEPEAKALADRVRAGDKFVVSIVDHPYVV